MNDQKENNVLKRVQKAGYKITASRRAVIKAFAREKDHLNPDEVLKRARRHLPNIGRATVYRTLELLTYLGLMRPIYLGRNRAAFTQIDHGHNHLVCSRCEKVVECEDPGFDAWSKRLARKTGFTVHSHLLEFYGFCKKCRGSSRN